jgi:hypothetical protein
MNVAPEQIACRRINFAGMCLAAVNSVREFLGTRRRRAPPERLGPESRRATAGPLLVLARRLQRDDSASRDRCRARGHGSDGCVQPGTVRLAARRRVM